MHAGNIRMEVLEVGGMGMHATQFKRAHAVDPDLFGSCVHLIGGRY